MRSVIGMDWDKSTNSLYAVVHGRDYLHMMWPGLYSPWESAVLPAEELFKVHQGIDGTAQLAKMEIRKKTASNIKDPDPIKDDLDRGKPVVASAVYTMY